MTEQCLVCGHVELVVRWVGLPIRAALALFASAVLLFVVLGATVIVIVVSPRHWDEPAMIFASGVDDMAYWTYYGESRP